MRAVITRVNEASVTIGGQETARIGKGFLVLLGVHVSDTAKATANTAELQAEHVKNAKKTKQEGKV